MSTKLWVENLVAVRGEVDQKLESLDQIQKNQESSEMRIDPKLKKVQECCCFYWGANSSIIALQGDALEILNALTGSEKQLYGSLYWVQLNKICKCLVKHCKNYPTAPKEFLENLTVQTFINGLKDIEIQRDLRELKMPSHVHCNMKWLNRHPVVIFLYVERDDRAQSKSTRMIVATTFLILYDLLLLP